MPIIENVEPIKIKVFSKAKSPNSLCVNFRPMKSVEIIEKIAIRNTGIATCKKCAIILSDPSLYRN